MRTSCPRTIDAKDSEKLLDALLSVAHTAKKKRQVARNHCMGMIMLEAGLRVGELVSLRLSDLYFNSVPVRTIVIKPDMTKNKVEHSIPVSPCLSETLSDYLDIVAQDFVYEIDFTRFAFGSSVGSLTTRQVERIISSTAVKALGRPINPHVLRHTFASRLMRITNLSTVQQLLGHKYIGSTQVYCHPNEDDKRQAIEAASAQLSPSQSNEQHPQQEPHQAAPVNPGPRPASQSGPQTASHW